MRSQSGRDTTASRPSYRTVQGLFFAVCLLVGPLVVAGLLAADFAAHPTQWGLLLGVVALVILLPFGALGMTIRAMPSSPWLATVGGFLALAGFIAYGIIVVWQEEVTYYSGRLGEGQQYTRLYDQINADPAMSVLLLVFILGHLLGPMLLGIGLGRARRIPPWALWALILRVPLQAAGFIAGIGLKVEIVTYGLLLIGSAPIAMSWLTEADYNAPQNAPPASVAETRP